MSNPLLESSSLPLFDRIQPADVAPAIDTLLARASEALETVVAPDFPAQWEAISAVLDVATEKLGTAWSAINHLNSVADTPELRAAYNEALPKVTEFWTNLGADERLYAKYKAIDPASLNKEQRAAWDHAMRGFVLSGAELQGAAKERFAQIQARSAELAQKFSENALDATDAFAYYARIDELDGVPADVIAAAKAAAEADGKEGYKLTLKMPSYLPVMQFAKSSALREKIYQAYVTRASDQADGDGKRFDNTAVMKEILALRLEESQLLGYSNFGEVSIVPKMADSPKQVIDFLRDLAQRARPYAEKDAADLRAFAKTELGIADPQPWDWAFIGEKLKEARYSFSEQELKQYFPAPKVLAGLFKIVETLFEVSIRRDEAPVWNPCVEFYRIERSTEQGTQLVGQFYLDPQARKGKRGGAWMDDVRTRWLRPDSHQLQTPVAHLVCNFASGVDGKPALLTHDDVITLFHETGHGLHHMLTQVNERDVSGIAGVEWDAVELPSQFMENFCWQREALNLFARHWQTGAALPEELFQRMLAARHFHAGLFLVRQLEYALFDFRLHLEFDPARGARTLVVLADVRREVAVIQPPPWQRMPYSFTHIFGGGYAAGYYSYLWAELLSADAFARFEESGIFNAAAGAAFRDNILAVGGSRPALESFVEFRGREPNADALLRSYGLMA